MKTMPIPPLNLVYDGECGLCKKMVRWVKTRDRTARIFPIAYQDSGELERLGLSYGEAKRQVHTVEAGIGKRGGAAAINRVFEILGGPWRIAAKAYTLRPVALLENRLYHWVSENRRWIGTRAGADASEAPTKDRSREVVVITGGTAGVGRATARHFARLGAKVAVLSRGADRLEATLRELESFGAEAMALSVDVADASQVEDAADHIEKTLGPIDIWINNAMVSVFSPIWEMAPEEYLRVTQVTYLGYVHGTLAALKRMRARNMGRIVQVGSALAYRGIPLQSAYCGAKHAVQGFTDSLRTELLAEKSGVRVCEVHLPALNTPQFGWVKSRLANKAQPVPPIYQPELAAETIYKAARGKRREWLLGWPTYLAIWGDKVAPGIADRYLAGKGFQVQQTDEAEDPARPDNLWAPPPGISGSHGRFDAESHAKSPLFLISLYREWILLALVTMVAAIGLRGKMHSGRARAITSTWK